MPIIFITGGGDTESGVRAMKGIVIGKPELFMLDDPSPVSGNSGPASAIVINLTSVLRGLRF